MIGLLVLVVAGGVVGLLLYGLTRLGMPREISDEEFEIEARRPSLMRTGLQEFHGFLEPEKRAAIEAVEQEKKKAESVVPGDRPESGG